MSQQLLQDAVADGARDNVSLVVVDLVEEDADISGDTAPRGDTEANQRFWDIGNGDTLPRMRSRL